jgi:mycothione reductase
MKTYDVIVIGSGGGMKLALPAAEMGLRTALIDQDAMGGTCLNRGCIPSKMLIYPTELPGLVRETRKIDVRSDSDPTIDFPSLMRRIQETINGIAENLRHTVMRTPNLDLYPYHGEFISDKILQVGPDQLTAETIFIATGSRPAIPDISGIKAVPFMTSREALSRTDLPRRLLVIGAGYIAVELGTAYAAAGAQVEFIVRSRFLRQEDQEVAEAFSHHFTQTHTVHQGWAPIKLSHDHDMVTVRCRDTTDQQRDFTADALLIATGVTPCTNDLGLKHTKIKTDDRGYIQVNNALRTGVSGIYALGDCAGNYLYRHTVNHEGEHLVRTVLRDKADSPIEYGPVPHAVFSHPEIAGVGLTEEQARVQKKDHVVGKADYAQSNAGLARGYKLGFVKILIERSTRQILGVHILGPEASDMIHLFIAMMKMKGTLEDLLDMIFIHPALPEVARDAARDARQRLEDR